MPKIKFELLSLGILPAVLMVAPSTAHAGGFYLQEQSVRAAGRAFSGEVADQGAQSLWWNPAAIGGSRGCEVALGASLLLPRATVNDLGSTITRPIPPAGLTTPVGGDATVKNPLENGILPSGSVACGFRNRIAFGISLTSPFSFTTEYPDTSWARYNALRSHLRTIDIQPSVAVELADGFSVGAGLNIEQMNAELTNSLPNISPMMPDGKQSLTGSGWDLGWSVGVRYARGPIELGASYKSSVKHTLDGEVEISGLAAPFDPLNGVTEAKARFRTPWQVIVGARAHVTPALTLNGQVTRVGWGEFDALRLGEPLNSSIPEDYEDTWAVSGGADYQLSPRTTLRAGVMFDESPVKDGNRDLRVPDTDRWTFTVGASQEVTESIRVDAALGYTTFEDGQIDHSVYPYGPGVVSIDPDGTITGAHAVVLSLGGRMAF